MSEEIVKKKNTKFHLIKNILFIVIGILLLCFVVFSGNLSKTTVNYNHESSLVESGNGSDITLSGRVTNWDSNTDNEKKARNNGSTIPSYVMAAESIISQPNTMPSRRL